MQPENTRKRLRRRARYDQLEERLALSAQPVADFWIEQELGMPVFHASEVGTALNDAHAGTGVDYVRNTYGLDGSGQTVAIIDSGIAYDHVALGGGYGASNRVVGGWDFAENDAVPYDDGPAGFHGTHVAGIVGSSSTSYRGVAPGVDLVSLRVFDDQGNGYFNWVEDALRWVHTHRNDFENPITTINLSLGTAWNANTVPDWGILEDEFAQLKTDGIFISVAAGNSFATYRTPGLSYPASSPNVVAVASVDNAGNLSSFSQRHDRVLAAPGQSIVSTVPDYLHGADGIKNDFGTASGTSMAAPYVAGAAALVRQAMQMAGVATINQDTIYAQLRNTATRFFDSATNAYYYRINVQAAIDPLMSADDYGSTVQTAYAWGTLNSTLSVDGALSKSTDRDYFKFTAGKTGRVTLSINDKNSLGITSELVGATKSGNSQTSFTFDVVAGQQYTIGVATPGGLGSYRVDATLTASAPSGVNWGSVSAQTFADQRIQGEAWYQFSSARTGKLTVEALFNTQNGPVDIELYNANRQLVASSKTPTSQERVDVNATTGQQYFLRVIGTHSDVDLRVTNLVTVTGTQVVVAGTSGNDTVEFTAGTQHRLKVNSVEYTFAANTVTSLTVDGSAGQDTLTYVGSTANHTATFRANTIQLSAGTLRVTGNGFETIKVTAGSGLDTVDFYDTAGNDRFTSRTTGSLLQGTGYSYEAVGFERVNAYATAGGTDRADLYDSPLTEQLKASPDTVTLQGGNRNVMVKSFDAVAAHSTAGGARDIAYLYDSKGNDRLTARPDSVTLEGTGFSIQANGFDEVRAYATAGGTSDTASMYDSIGNDRFIAAPSSSSLTGTGFANYATGFDQVIGYATAGGTDDRAYLYDSAGDDIFAAGPTSASIRGNGYSLTANTFEKVYGNANAGGTNDRATLYGDGATSKTSNVDGWMALEGRGFSNSVRGFDRLDMYSAPSGQRLALPKSLAVMSEEWVGVDTSGTQTAPAVTSRIAKPQAAKVDGTDPAATEIRTVRALAALWSEADLFAAPAASTVGAPRPASAIAPLIELARTAEEAAVEQVFQAIGRRV